MIHVIIIVLALWIVSALALGVLIGQAIAVAEQRRPHV